MRNPHPIDVHVGNRLRLARLARGMTQGELAAEARLSFQQIQKYEKGHNRISASRLYELARTLRVEINYFFDEFEKADSEAAPATSIDDQGTKVGLMLSGIEDEQTRETVLKLITILSQNR